MTLAVDPDAAARIASALETGSITLVRATGATPLQQTVPFDPVAGAAATAGGAS